MHIHLLDLIGTFAFAVFGAHVGIKKKLDLFGILTCAFLTAVGGGSIREVLLNRTPFYFFNNAYIETIIAGTAFSLITYTFFGRIEKLMQVIDAVGLSSFALIGASAAVNARLGLFSVILLAIINAAGGGILRDVAVREIPIVFHKELYAVPAGILGLFFGLFIHLRTSSAFIVGILLLAFSLRLISIFSHVGLWHPWVKLSVQPDENLG